MYAASPSRRVRSTFSWRQAGFARAVLDRFRNPFIDHKLADIAAHHAAKVPVRLEPTREEYRAMFGKEPALLGEVLVLPAPVL